MGQPFNPQSTTQPNKLPFHSSIYQSYHTFIGHIILSCINQRGKIEEDDGNWLQRWTNMVLEGWKGATIEGWRDERMVWCTTTNGFIHHRSLLYHLSWWGDRLRHFTNAAGLTIYKATDRRDDQQAWRISRQSTTIAIQEATVRPNITIK